MVFRVTDLISNTNAVWVRELMDGVENVVIEWNANAGVFLLTRANFVSCNPPPASILVAYLCASISCIRAYTGRVSG